MFGALPTLLTLSNGLCGLASVLVASGSVGEFDASDRFYYAAIWIYVGMLFDMLDGQAARLLKQTSRFGAQLDSMCDVITFGMAPVFLLLRFDEILHPRLMLAIAAIYLSCVLLRLARFNVEVAQSDSHTAFSGLPSPAAAATIASFAVMIGSSRIADAALYQHLPWLSSVLRATSMVAVPTLSLVLAVLMISRVQYPHVVNRWLVKRYGFDVLAPLMVMIVLVVLSHEVTLPLLLFFFVMSAPITAIWHKIRPPQQPAEKESRN